MSQPKNSPTTKKSLLQKPSANSRRAAREVALRVLYTHEVGHAPLEEILEETIAAHTLEDTIAEFARHLVMGTYEHHQDLDMQIVANATGYPLDRQTVVDKNILRLAAAEILYSLSDAPIPVVVNEAIELAKKYSTDEAIKFINGVLGGLLNGSNNTNPVLGGSPDRDE
jgi:transcription antitermination protein NusB